VFVVGWVYYWYMSAESELKMVESRIERLVQEIEKLQFNLEAEENKQKQVQQQIDKQTQELDKHNKEVSRIKQLILKMDKDRIQEENRKNKLATEVANEERKKQEEDMAKRNKAA